MKIHEYRLPKSVEAAPRAAHLLQQLAAHERLLWEGASRQAAFLVPGTAVTGALRSAHQGGLLLRGLEAAERRLREEEHGLELRPGQAPRESGVRISRLVVVTDDGSQRFYRNVEGLLRRHAPRVYAVRLGIDEHALGELLYGPGRVARLVLLEHKKAVADLLLAIAEQWQEETARE